ncbi:unnamed protein product [Rotaria socialis]|uniref:Uncharacterized protein n=4 Tax=Rotaria TaxID=231623 RepID=A0A820ZSI3_9BILA|nr:unnamed protein product [Rotaria socialis]
MSQLSNSTMNQNISSDLSVIKSDNKDISTGTEKEKKRAAPLPPAGQAKNNMTAHHSCEKQAPNVTSKYVDQSKFIPLEKQNLEYISQTTTTTTTNTTKFSDSIMASTQHKETTELSAQTMKRSISSDIQMETKKIMVNHESSKQTSQFIAVAPPPMKFVSAATMVVSKNITNIAIPEISDEELLEMALTFEKEQQQ